MTDSALQNIIAIKQCVLDTLDQNKALDIVEIDLRGKSTIADFMIVASGSSNRAVAALAQKVLDETARAFPAIPQRVEGKTEADWVLVDLDDVIIHIFRPEVREFYALEKMWTMTSPSTEHKRMVSKKTNDA